MSKNKRIALRLTPSDYEELRSFSPERGVSETVRTFIAQGIQEASKKDSEAQTLDGGRFAIQPQ